MDIEKGLCKGCARSREEIAMWTRYTDAKRAVIMGELDKRMEEMDVKK